MFIVFRSPNLSRATKSLVLDKHEEAELPRMLQFGDMNPPQHSVLFLLGMAFVLLGCQRPPQANHVSLDLRYLALGDSYTIGESVAEGARWPQQLVDSLNRRLQGRTLLSPATIVATTGWTTADLDAGMDASQVDTATWDLVSLLIGVNNQYQGLPLADYEEEFADLLVRAVSLTGGRPERVFVVSIPDYACTPFGQPNQEAISSDLATFNATCKAEAQALGVAHMDITPISQQWPDLDGLVASDGLHPSALQYALWVEHFVAEVALQIQ